MYNIRQSKSDDPLWELGRSSLFMETAHFVTILMGDLCAVLGKVSLWLHTIGFIYSFWKHILGPSMEPDTVLDLRRQWPVGAHFVLKK